MNNRKLGRKITIEIYQNNVHTQTQVSAIYKTDLEGNPIEDPFKNAKTMWDVRAILLLQQSGRKYLHSSFETGDSAEDVTFVLVKINKRGMSHKQYISKYEFCNCTLRRANATI